MVNLNELKKLGWLTCRQIIEKHGGHNPDLMKRVIKSKGSEYPEDRKIILRKKGGEDEYIYSPDLIKKIVNSFILEDYYATETRKDNLLRQDCYTSKELASKFKTTQECLLAYIRKEGLDKTGFVKEVKEGYLIHKKLYQKLECHFYF